MSNSVTNTKLPTVDAQSQGGGKTAPNGLNQTASATVSAGQGREIFNQVNVSLGANLHNSDIIRRREKTANNNSESKRTDWKAIKQGTDSAKKSKIQGTDSTKTQKNQGTDSPKTSKNPHDRSARPNNPDNRESKEQTRNNNRTKSNNNHQTTKSDDESNNDAPKSRNQTATQNNENRGARSNNQPRAETSNNEKDNGNRGLSSRDGGNSAKSNTETNRPDSTPNYRNNTSQTQSNKGQGAANASTNESNRGQEYSKSEQSNPNSMKTPQSNLNSLKPSSNNQNSANTLKDAAETTLLFNNRNQQTANNAPGRHVANTNAPQTRHLNLTDNFPNRSNPENNSNSHGNRQSRFLVDVISRIFRENDIYLSRDAVDTLVEHRGGNVLNRSGNPAFELLPKEIFQLIQAIENQILQTSDRRQIDDKHTSNQLNIRIPQELDNQIQAAKNLFTQIFGTSDAKHFSQLNIRERMLAAIEMFLRNLPAEMPGNLQNNSSEKVLAGFLLARGLVCSDGRNRAENLLGMMQSAAADKVSLAAMRDFGGLVKVLISDAATSKSTANLETAVEKFARILVAINCLDTVLTAVKLASQNQFAGGNVGRTLAIVQVYELINRLVLAGQNAMKEAAAEVAQKNAQFKGEPDKNSRSVFPAKTVADLTETDTANKKNGESKNVVAESALRKYLEFNPMLAADKFISAFENSDDARQAQNDFLNHHQIEIEQWLRSGNHRLVKDVDFEKPIGIVVERNASDFFSATTARIVLVRDGSVQGWHFLKSFLVA